MATGIDRLASGRFRARIFRDGKKYTVGTFATQKEAVMARARAMVLPEEDRRGQMKFWKYAETHLKVEKSRWAPGTWENNTRSYRLYLEPFFGQKKMCDISPALVKRWWVSMDERPGPRRAAYMVLSGIMSAAEGDEEIVRWRGIKGASRDVSRARPAAPVNDIKVLTMLAGDAQVRTMVTVLLHSGLRIGELLALTWEDFNGEALRINKHVTDYGTFSGRKKHPSYDAWQHLTADALIALEDFKASTKCTGPMWLNLHGKALSYHAWFRRWDDLRKSYGLDSIRVHDIRATHLTAFREQGATEKEVMDRGGHTDPRAMLRYQRPADERQKTLVAQLTF